MKRFNFVTGERNKGKTAYLKALSQDKEFKGILTLSTTREKDELYILNLETKETFPFMKRTPEGPYEANQETFRIVNDYIQSITEGNVILDECGRIELNKQGFYTSLIHIVNTPEITCYIAVRDTNLEAMIKLLELKDNEYTVITV